MKEIFAQFLSAGLSGSMLILAVIAVRLLLRKASKRHICLLWLLVGLRLLVPFTIESNLSLQPDQSAVMQPNGEVFLGEQMFAPGQVTPHPTDVPNASAPSVGEVPGTIPQGSTNTPTVANKTDYATVASWVWLIGSGAMLAYALISYQVLKKKLCGAIPLQPGVFEDPTVRSPFLLGYLQPGIYLPYNVPEEYRSHILAHERCHIRRGDHWMKLFGFVCLALHWYNPLVWLAYSLLCKDMEMACDEAVIQAMDTQQRKIYSAALLSCASERLGFSACPVAFGEDNVKQRILNVLRYRKPAVWISAVAVIAAAVLAVCFLTNPMAQTDPTTPEKLDPVERCRLAVEQLQSSDTYALWQNRHLSGSFDYFYAWDTAISLRHGDNWYHCFESTDYVNEYFAYNGRQLVTYISSAMTEGELIYSEWTEKDLSNDPFVQHPYV